MLKDRTSNGEIVNLLTKSGPETGLNSTALADQYREFRILLFDGHIVFFNEVPEIKKMKT